MTALLEFSEGLEKLPEGIKPFPESLKPRIRYDPDKKEIVLQGVLTAKERDALRSLSDDDAYLNAIENLYWKSRRPPDDLIWREIDDSKYVTEELTQMKRRMYISLAVWFILLGGLSVYFLFHFWPSAPKTRIDSKLDSLSQQIRMLQGGAADSAAKKDSIRLAALTHRADSLGRLVTQPSRLPPSTVMPRDTATAAPTGEKEGSVKGGNTGEVMFLLIALLAGVLGGSAGGLSSLMDFRGQRRLFRSWTLWYFAQPLVAGMIATIFYMVVRAGFFSTETSLQGVNVFGIAAFSALVGLFTDDATTKLSEVFKTMFASTAKPREGALHPETKEPKKAS
jgi:hypothetical protein